MRMVLSGLTAVLCACSALPAQETAMTEVACTIDGKATGELPAEAICALFQPALEARPGARVHITMPSDHQAQVQLFDADGSVLAEGGGSVSDRQYHRGAWERLVVAIIQQLG